MSPSMVFIAICRLERDLPSLVGSSEWSNISTEFTEKLQLINQNPSSVRDVDVHGLLEILRPYSLAMRRLREEIENVSITKQKLEIELKQVSRGLNIDEDKLQKSIDVALRVTPTSLSDNDASRHVKITEGGLKLNSWKFQNIDWNPNRILEMAIGIVAAVSPLQEKDIHPILVVLGILLIFRTIIDSATVEVSEKDYPNAGSVLWGFMQVGLRRHGVSETEITYQTNSEREKFGLLPLTPNEVKYALNQLSAMKIVNQLDKAKGYWQIIETISVKQ